MPLDAWFAHRCTIQRPQKVDDAYRNARVTYENVTTDQRFRLVARTRRVAISDVAAGAVITNWLALFPPGTDVKPGDRIVDAVLEDGTTDAGPFTILSLLPRRGVTTMHLSAELQRVGVGTGTGV